MLVYGDHQETVCPLARLAEIKERAASLAGTPCGIARHASAVETFILLSGVAQGYADRELEAKGHDDVSNGQQVLQSALRGLAEWIHRSWRSGFREQRELEIGPLGSIACWPTTIEVKRSEGFAFYGVYPEAYLEAATGLPDDSVVIGLRSIGTGLAALVAAASGARTVITLRPSGHPFSRGVQAGPGLTAFVREQAHRHFVIVDEGPGLSGSSFGGVADWLTGLGVAEDRIVFMPSHAGELGPEASPRHRERWQRADRRVRTFEQVFATPGSPCPLREWFADATGPLTHPPACLSGGSWATAGRDTPTSPGREARKYLLQGASGAFVAKFVGLDLAARGKVDRARALHQAGFSPEPIAFRYGFLLEPFLGDATAGEVPVGRIADYCAFRHEHFPGPVGATLLQLFEMARHNLGEFDPALAARFAARWTQAQVGALQELVEPVHIDGRLHRWEWLCSGGRTLKTDAVDHSQAHDLVGCQDILWDVAGATVELAEAAAGEAELAARFACTVGRRELLQYLKACYLAFQLGWWSFSGTARGLAQSRLYGRRAVELLAVPA